MHRGDFINELGVVECIGGYHRFLCRNIISALRDVHYIEGISSVRNMGCSVHGGMSSVHWGMY